MKVCRECNVNKPLTEYYAHSQMQDGYLNKCKDCVKTRVHKHRENNLDAVRDYDKKRSLLPHRVQARKKYIKTEQGKIAKKKAMLNYKNNYPLKYAAQKMFSLAVKRGELIRPQNCSECNSSHKIEGHHDNYTKPFDVRWLCEQCHKKWHKYNKAVYI